MRLGELIGLQRGDVDLAKRTVTVQRTFSAGFGISTPKSGKGRTLNLTEDAVHVFRAWFELQGVRAVTRWCSPNEAGGYLDPRRCCDGSCTRRWRTPTPTTATASARTNGESPGTGERGNPRVFHSFRHTFARLVLENGGSREWLNKQLGHSTLRDDRPLLRLVRQAARTAKRPRSHSASEPV